MDLAVKKEHILAQYIEETSSLVERKQIKCLLETVKKQIGCQEEVLCYENPYLKVPILIGHKQKKLILPVEQKEEKEYYLILLHELMHIKRKDIEKRRAVQRLINFLWFQPVIYSYAKTYNHWSELVCDEMVMGCLNKEEQKEYIQLIVRMVESGWNNKMISAVSFGGTDMELEQRIQHLIRIYKNEIVWINPKKVIGIFALMALISVNINFFIFEAAESYYCSVQEEIINVCKEK